MTVLQKYHISKYFLQRIKVASVIQTKSGTTCLLNYDLSGGHIIDFPTTLYFVEKEKNSYYLFECKTFFVYRFKFQNKVLSITDSTNLLRIN